MKNITPFKLHNIELLDGTHTIPGKPLWKDTAECQHAVAILNSIYPDDVRPTIKVADLGGGEGGYAVEFSRYGYDVTVYEARDENVHRICYAAAGTGSPMTIWQQDIKKINEHYDVIFCSGLLYHIDKPVEFLNKISALCDVLILNTHFARIKDNRYDKLSYFNQVKKRFWKRLPWVRRYHFGLSAIAINEGWLGRWYREYSPKCSDVEKRNWAAYSNHRSFWLTNGGIRSVLMQTGFKTVRQFDNAYPKNFDRRFFLGIKAILVFLMMSIGIAKAQTWPSKDCPDSPYTKGNDGIIYHTGNCGVIASVPPPVKDPKVRRTPCGPLYCPECHSQTNERHMQLLRYETPVTQWNFDMDQAEAQGCPIQPSGWGMTTSTTGSMLVWTDTTRTSSQYVGGTLVKKTKKVTSSPIKTIKISQ